MNIKSMGGGEKKKKKLTGNIILIRTGRIVSNFYLLPYKFLFNVKLLHPKSYYSNSSAWYPEQLNSPFVFDRWNDIPDTVTTEINVLYYFFFYPFTYQVFFLFFLQNSIKEGIHSQSPKGITSIIYIVI